MLVGLAMAHSSGATAPPAARVRAILHHGHGRLTAGMLFLAAAATAARGALGSGVAEGDSSTGQVEFIPGLVARFKFDEVDTITVADSVTGRGWGPRCVAAANHVCGEILHARLPSYYPANKVPQPKMGIVQSGSGSGALWFTGNTGREHVQLHVGSGVWDSTEPGDGATAGWSISLWYLPITLGNVVTLAQAGKGTSSGWFDDGFAFYTHFGRTHLRIGGSLLASSTVDVELGAWHHMACTFEDGTAKVYMNGTELVTMSGMTDVPYPPEASAASGDDSATGQTIVLSGGAHTSIDGFADDFRLYKKALSSEEVALLSDASWTAQHEVQPPVVETSLPQSLWLEAGADPAPVSVAVSAAVSNGNVVGGPAPAASHLWHVDALLTDADLASKATFSSGGNGAPAATSTLAECMATFQQAGHYALAVTITTSHYTVTEYVHVDVFPAFPSMGGQDANSMPPSIVFDPVIIPPDGPNKHSVVTRSRFLRIPFTVEDAAADQVVWTSIKHPTAAAAVGGAGFQDATLSRGIVTGITATFPAVGLYTLKVAALHKGAVQVKQELAIDVRARHAIAHWPMDESVGVTMHDTVNGFDGTVQATWRHDHQTEDTRGDYPGWLPANVTTGSRDACVFGGCIALPGNGYDAAYPLEPAVQRSHVVMDTLNMTEPVTAALWFKATMEWDVDRARSYSLFATTRTPDPSDGSLSPGGSLGVEIASLNPDARTGGAFDTAIYVTMYSGDGIGPRPMLTAVGKWQRHVWNHLTVTFQNGSAALYLNGSLVETIGRQDTVGPVARNTEGGGLLVSTTRTHYAFSGLIDDFAVFDFAMGSAEITALRDYGAEKMIEYLGRSNTGVIMPDKHTISGAAIRYTVQDELHPVGYTNGVRDLFRREVDASVSDASTIAVDITPPPQPVPPGAHPRLWFSPTELQAVRQRVLGSSRQGGSKTARHLYGSLQHAVGRNFPDINAVNSTGAFARDCFSALLNADAEQGRIQGSGLASWAEHMMPFIMSARASTSKPWDRPWPHFGSMEEDWRKKMHHFGDSVALQHVGVAYDLCYNYMTPNEQTLVRKFIALGSAHMHTTGMYDILTERSNWVPLVTYHLNTLVLAIEGEDGYDGGVAKEIRDLMMRVYTNAIFPSGAPYEGMGKMSTGFTSVYMTLRRMSPVDAGLIKQRVGRFVGHFLLHRMVPWGGDAFGSDDTWGFSDKPCSLWDVIGAKVLFPEDKRIDYVLSAVLKHPSASRRYSSIGVYSSKGWETDSNTFGSALGMISMAIDPTAHFGFDQFDATFAVPSQEVGSTYDHHGIGERELQGRNWLQDNVSKTYVCCRRGIAVTRSSWMPSATQLTFQPRHGCGHCKQDRGYFTLYSLGRTWLGYWGNAAVPGQTGSIMYFNGVPSSSLSASFTQVIDKAEATVVTADLTHAYRFKQHVYPSIYGAYTATYKELEGKGVCPAERGWVPDVGGGSALAQDFAESKSPWSTEWMNLPMETLNTGILGFKQSSYKGLYPLHADDTLPLGSYKRTAALVRGSAPEGYVVMVDDVTFDNTTGAHGSATSNVVLRWQARLEDDLVGDWAPVTLDSQGQGAAVVVTDTATGNRLYMHAVAIVTRDCAQLDASPSENADQEVDQDDYINGDDNIHEAERQLAADAASVPEATTWAGDAVSVYYEVTADASPLPSDAGLAHAHVTLVTALVPLVADAPLPSVTARIGACGAASIDIKVEDSADGADRLWLLTRPEGSTTAIDATLVGIQREGGTGDIIYPELEASSSSTSTTTSTTPATTEANPTKQPCNCSSAKTTRARRTSTSTAPAHHRGKKGTGNSSRATDPAQTPADADAGAGTDAGTGGQGDDAGSSSSSSSSSGGVIAGAVIGALVVVGVVGAAVWFITTGRHRSSTATTTINSGNMEAGGVSTDVQTGIAFDNPVYDDNLTGAAASNE